MKVSKTGKLRLDANERRIGNFVLRKDEEYMKVCDIGRIFIYSVRRDVPAGMFLAQCYDDFKDEETTKGIGNYIAVLWTFFSAVPDAQFLQDSYDAAYGCIKRHPEAYGFQAGEVTDDADAEALQAVREMTEFEEEVRKVNTDQQKVSES